MSQNGQEGLLTFVDLLLFWISNWRINNDKHNKLKKHLKLLQEA